MKRLILPLVAAGIFLPSPAAATDTPGWNAAFNSASEQAMAEALKQTEHRRNQVYE